MRLDPAVVPARCRAVENYDADTVDDMDGVERAIRIRDRVLAQELSTECRPLVVISHRVDRCRTERPGYRLDQFAQPTVCGGVSVIGHVTGEDHGVHALTRRHQLIENAGQIGIGVDAAVDQFSFGSQMRIGQLHQRECRLHSCRVHDAGRSVVACC